MYINLVLRKKTIFKGVIENMSKMRVPEISVVRFTESDVIVASDPLQIVNLQKGDGSGNGAMTYRGSTYTYDNYGSLITLLDGRDEIYSDTDNTNYSVTNLFETDSNPSTQYNIGTPDGTYYYNGMVGRWVRAQ